LAKDFESPREPVRTATKRAGTLQTMMTRRIFLTTTTAAAGALAAGGRAFAAPVPASRKRLGLSIASYSLRWRSKHQSTAHPAWSDALAVLEHCRALGAGCLQIGVGGWQADFAGKVRDKRESLGIALEGQINLPKSGADVPAFEAAVRAAKEAGATILRTVCLNGRRYETFASADAWRQFRSQSLNSLSLAEPVLRRQRVKLAVENHKDWRVAELLEVLRHFNSEWIGVNLDFGNNLALLEDPLAVVEALAPFTLTTHFKDMAVEESPDGFLLSEVPLGDGFLDLPRMIEICERANPAVQFNLEMITRDPLRVPVLGRKYWTTFGDLPARDLAATLALVRERKPRHPLPRLAGKSPDEQLAFEEENNVRSFAYATEKLGFAK
jgi:sugar phosphate isomerase/epimerase